MTKINGEEAAKSIGSSSHASYEIVGFDEVEAKRLGVEAGKSVAITPDDSGMLVVKGLSHNLLIYGS